MRKFHLTLLLLCGGFLLQAQTPRNSILYNLVEQRKKEAVSFAAVPLFKTGNQNNAPAKNIVANSTILLLDKTIAAFVTGEKPPGVSITVPLSDRSYTLLLVQQPINSTGDFSFGSIENGVTKKLSADQGLHYRGCIDGDPSSMACMSLFENGEVMAVFSNKEGNFNLGKTIGGEYIIYNSNDVPDPPQYACTSDETLEPGNEIHNGDIVKALRPTDVPPVLCNKVRLYWEGNYSLYSARFGSNITLVKNYLTGLFNVVAAVYQNEGIIAELAESYVWTAADPYADSSSAAALGNFRARWNGMANNFNGNLAHLISGGSNGNGGRAYYANLCGRSSCYGYSNTYGFYSTLPTYSWDVEVISHETGHNLGSHHTHWCGWNTGAGGTCGAIDNCYTIESNGTCTTCPATTDIASPPVGFKGTVMSYCHLLSSIRINLALGFGPLPQAIIRDKVSTATCFTKANSWAGTIDRRWELPANWSCGTVPDAQTDVTINPGLVNYPIVNTAAICKSITQKTGSTVEVKPGFTLQVVGLPNH